MARSRWRDQAWGHITLTLAGLPAEDVKDERAARAALRRAYPFGQMSGHPYKMWLEAVRDAMRTMFGRPKPHDVSAGPHGVSCLACKGEAFSGGCILCMRHRSWHAALPRQAREDWSGLLASVGKRVKRKDAAACAALADWIEENGQGLAGLAGGAS